MGRPKGSKNRTTDQGPRMVTHMMPDDYSMPAVKTPDMPQRSPSCVCGHGWSMHSNAKGCHSTGCGCESFSRVVSETESTLDKMGLQVIDVVRDGKVVDGMVMPKGEPTPEQAEQLAERKIPPMPTFAPGLVPVFNDELGVWEALAADMRVVGGPMTSTAPTDGRGGPAVVAQRTVEPFADVQRVDHYRELMRVCKGRPLGVEFRNGQWRIFNVCGDWPVRVAVEHPDFHEACRRFTVLLNPASPAEQWMPCGGCAHINGEHDGGKDKTACRHGCGCRGWKR